MAFRQFAFVMVVVTVLGAIELSHLFESLRERASTQTVTAATVTILALFVLLSAVTVFPSPYIVKPSGHVTDQRLDGHQSAFEFRADGQDYSSVRAGPGRFVHAVFGIDRPTHLKTNYHGSSISGKTFAAGNYTETYPDGQYLLISTADHQREVQLYRGLRYSEEGFDQLPHNAGVDKVMTNGQVDLYSVKETS